MAKPTHSLSKATLKDKNLEIYAAWELLGSYILKADFSVLPQIF